MERGYQFVSGVGVDVCVSSLLLFAILGMRLMKEMTIGIDDGYGKRAIPWDVAGVCYDTHAARSEYKSFFGYVCDSPLAE